MTDEVLVIGDLMVDVVVRPAGPIQSRSDTASSIELHGGGSAANTACWLAAIGRQVRLVAAVGDDALGRLVLEELEAAGVAFAGQVVPGRATGTCVVLVDDEGERTMLPDRGANEGLAPDVVDAAVARGPTWLHLSGYALLGSGSRPAARSAMGQASRVGVPWSVDASSAAPLRAVGPDGFLTWIDGCALLLANDDECQALGGEATALGAAREMVTKHGALGASWTDGRTSVHVPPPPVEVVSAVGAGDAFDAGYLDARLSGSAPEAALTAGARLAAQALARAGARP